MKKPALIFCLLISVIFGCESNQSDAFEDNSRKKDDSELIDEKTSPNSQASPVSFDASEENDDKGESLSEEKSQVVKPVIDPEQDAISPTSGQIDQTMLLDRFDPPSGFQRVAAPEGSYGYYLQHLPLKPEGTEVKYYNGGIKPNQGVYVAVVDMEIGTRDLQQCADAIMRLRAEYLWHMQQYDQIHFNFTNGFQVDYDKWRKGNRIKFNGNRTSWVQNASPSNSYKSFRKYMDLIFAYAGTASLEKELKYGDPNELKIGDIFIQGGFPGHAVVVVDKAINPSNGEMVFILAQSYMPAQDIQILQNPNDSSISPWYSWPIGGTLYTPEWHFDDPRPKQF